jgi:hypothetical protein
MPAPFIPGAPNAWVRGEQSAGGKSKFHLYLEARRGRRGFSSPEIVTYARTACAFRLEAPFELQLGSAPARYHGGVALPLDGRGRPVDEFEGLLCTKCLEMAWALLNSSAA